eukprot:CAMPEP_0172662214 /NCGR_PEP_ID=MMETSP1074-20121228/5221_1 /TAXON_ID=2916 /ORGANISM="Ceratium fusus, Strain PA161109" /LENGTH=246 /DNA_ID=CAMNT_0013478099 /DNA_START=68 /DNA_END=810 /DNA_ORIENTATION=+
MMRHLSSGRGHRRDQKPSHAAKFVAILGTMMALGLFWGTDAAAFLGPARKGWSEQLVVTPGSSVVAASVRSVTASSLLRPRATGLPGAGASATNVFWAIVLFVGTCSVRGTATSRRASQHKLRSCSVTCQAVGLPMPVMFQPRTPAVEEWTHTPAVAPPPKVAHATKPRTIAFRAVMVGGVVAQQQRGLLHAVQGSARQRTKLQHHVQRAELWVQLASFIVPSGGAAFEFRREPAAFENPSWTVLG